MILLGALEKDIRLYVTMNLLYELFCNLRFFISFRVTGLGPIEYQKEMDTDKESNKGTLEKQKDKDKVI